LPGIRIEQASGQPNQRRFARAVGTDQSRQAAGLRLDGHAVQGLNLLAGVAAKGFFEVAAQ
jgi:hypothetical protein